MSALRGRPAVSGLPPARGLGRRARLAATLALLAATAVGLLGAGGDAGPRHARAASAGADPPYTARVLRVRDGDSLLVEAGGARIEIRVFGIDAPERGQPWAKRARSALAALVADGTLRVVPRDRDAYGRTVAELEVDGACVACALVRDGHAWVYRRYTDDPTLLALEDEARAARRGLWGLSEAERVPPWDWRHRPRPPRDAKAPAPGAALPAP